MVPSLFRLTNFDEFRTKSYTKIKVRKNEPVSGIYRLFLGVEVSLKWLKVKTIFFLAMHAFFCSISRDIIFNLCYGI